jgi:ABC-2 type transport system permease protein
VRTALRIAGKDLKLRLRDRSALIIGIIAPLSLAFILNLVFGSAFDPTQGIGLEYGVVDLDRSEISTSFTSVLEEIEAEGILELERFSDVESADEAIDQGEVDSYFLLQPGFGQSVGTNQPATIQVIGDVDSPTSTQIAASIADQFATGVEAAQLAIATTSQLSSTPVTPEFLDSLQTDPRTAAFSYRFDDVSTATRQLDATTYLAAGMAVFFLFFTVGFGVLGLLEEERQGTLTRLMAAPIARASIVGGKAILSFILGLISMFVLVVATQLLMGATWGAPLGVALLVVAGVLSAVGIIGLVAAFAKTPEGAENLSSIIAVILGMLGGVFFQVGQSGDLLSRLTFITPHAWFMRGLADLADGAPWTAALPATGAILIFAVVTGAISWFLLMRRLRR